MSRLDLKHWNAYLQFRSVCGRSILGKQYVRYPYHVTRPLYDDLEQQTVPKIILQSLSGGIYKNEKLSHEYDIQNNAKVDIRTQGSTIVHDAQEGKASSDTLIRVGPGSSIFYITEPQIIFDGANFWNSVEVRGIENAEHAVVADSFLAYDPLVDPTVREFQFTTASCFSDVCGNVLAIDKSIIKGPSYYRVMNGYKGYVSVMFHGQDFTETFLRECCRKVEVLGAIGAYSTLPRSAGYSLKALTVDGAGLSAVLNLVRNMSVPLGNRMAHSNYEL